MSLYEHQNERDTVGKSSGSRGIGWREKLAYELLFVRLASFGGGPNVKSRGTVSKGVNLYRADGDSRLKADRAREYLARKSTWRESYFLAAFSAIKMRGIGARRR